MLLFSSYLAGPARLLLRAPTTMRVPTYVLPRKGRGWRRCEHTGSVPIVLHDTHCPEPIHDPIYEREENYADQKAHAQSSRSQRRSQPEVLSRDPWPGTSHQRSRAVSLRFRVGVEWSGRNFL